MCLATPQSQPIILKEDKVVYKVLRVYKDTGRLEAPYRDTAYVLGVTHQSPITFEVEKKNFENISFCIWDMFRSHYDSFLESFQCVDEMTLVNMGLHAFTDLEIAKQEAKDWSRGMPPDLGYNYQVFKAIIPAGSEYWYNMLGECVSDQLIIEHEL